ncbi:hypothetical protein VS883_27915, partial [Escherichia coli]
GGTSPLAPDGLSSVGGYPGNDDKGRELQQQVDPVVVHENRGLNPYIEDVTAASGEGGGTSPLAPDGLSSVGGYPGNDDKGRELQQQVDP